MPLPLKVDGRFFSSAGTRVYLNGVTLGPFPPSVSLLPELAKISALGANMVRLYEPPTIPFLNEAQRLGIYVFASVPWDWEYNFITTPSLLAKGRHALQTFLGECSTHPALVGLYIANEIRSELVHEMGVHKVKHALEHLIYQLRSEFPDLLYSYANYPTTEFLELANTDFTSFNVYLEHEHDYRSYLQHLHLVAGERPLLISEFGADVNTHGEHGQDKLLRMGRDIAREEGIQGFTIFSWSDLWFNNGTLVTGWKFGLKTIQNTLRPSAQALRNPPSLDTAFQPLFSVIVCTYNGALRVESCLQALLQLNDQNYEVVIINDGSTDWTAEVVASYLPHFKSQSIPYTVYTQKNKGLSAARNTGAELASGDLIAYTDDDARPDQDWLYWLRTEFSTNNKIAMVGGYGLAPESGTSEASEVSRLPGQACPVLTGNREAEHLPGCNMAVRKTVWKEIHGFSSRYRVAGDDVDFCWRVLNAGYLVHFHPCAIVWHESRATYKAYFKQQWGYGKAEALLYHDHPERFGSQGIHWKGGIYDGTPRLLTTDSLIYTGIQNTALFQPIIYGSTHSQATTVRGKIAALSYLWVRALARLVYS